MFGRTPHLPVDLAFRLAVHEERCQSHSQYVKHLKERLKESYKIASENTVKSTDPNKLRFDKHVQPSTLETGDPVLVRNVWLRGKHKLSDKWEQDTYMVVKRAGDLPVYTVMPEGREGPTRTLHRDLLLPCGLISEAQEATSDADPVAEPRQTRLQRRPQMSEESAEGEEVHQQVLSNLIPDPVRFTVKGVCTHKPSPSSDTQPLVASNLLATEPPTSPGSPHLPNHVEHLPETLPETLPEHLPDPASPLSSEVPCEDNSDPGEDGNIETNLAEPQNLDCFQNLPEIEQSPRRSNLHRSPPKRFNYISLGNPLISVVQTLLHGLSDVLGAPPVV